MNKLQIKNIHIKKRKKKKLINNSPAYDFQGFLWPGFGDNVRVLDWVMRRMDETSHDTPIACSSPIGVIPKREGFNLEGLGPVNWAELFRFDKDFWAAEASHIEKYFKDNIGEDLPPQIMEQVQQLKERVSSS